MFCREETKEETKEAREEETLQELFARYCADNTSNDDSDTVVVDNNKLTDSNDDLFFESTDEDVDVLGSSSDEDLGLDIEDLDLGDSSSCDSDIEPVRLRPEIAAAVIETKSAKDLAARNFAREMLEVLEASKMDESILERQLKIFHSFMVATFGEGEVPALTQDINFPRTLFQMYKFAEMESMESVLLDVCPNGSAISSSSS
jgi:hypothetical protein